VQYRPDHPILMSNQYFYKSPVDNIFDTLKVTGRMKFDDDSKTQIGKQIFKNRLGLLNDIDFHWQYGITDSAIRTKLKKFFNMATPGGEVVFPLGGANKLSSNPSFPPLTKPSGAHQGPCHGTHRLHALMNGQRRRILEIYTHFNY